MSDQILDDASIALIKSKNLPISLAAIEEIIFEEDSSESYYNKIYQHPEWPGGASGVTIGLGYDLGYTTHDKVINDFSGKISNDMLIACLSCVGKTGSTAFKLLKLVHSKITIPWSIALDVFLNNNIPQWINTVEHSLQNTNLLSPDSLGAMVSLAYNRGASFARSGDRFLEMRAIALDMQTKNFKDIPNQFRRMSRLWPSTSGVHKRRFREADLFEKGLLIS